MKGNEIILLILCFFFYLQDWSGQDATSIASEICGFITVLSGTIMLHSTREPETVNGSGISKLDFKEKYPILDR